MNFGFQSTLDKIESLLRAATGLLDGRSDALELMEKKSRKRGVSKKRIPFTTPRARWALDSDNSVVCKIKLAVIGLMLQVADLRANFRLSKLLESLNAMVADPLKAYELRRLHCYIAARKVKDYRGPLVEEIFETFEALFTEGDGARLDLEQLSGQPVNEILLDCLMYEDDALFAGALGLLERTFKQRAKLIEAAAGVTLLEDERLPVFGHTATLLSELVLLNSAAQVPQLWATKSKLSGDFDQASYEVHCGYEGYRGERFLLRDKKKGGGVW